MHYADTDEAMVSSFVLTTNKNYLLITSTSILSSPPIPMVLLASKSSLWADEIGVAQNGTKPQVIFSLISGWKKRKVSAKLSGKSSSFSPTLIYL